MRDIYPAHMPHSDRSTIYLMDPSFNPSCHQWRMTTSGQLIYPDSQACYLRQGRQVFDISSSIATTISFGKRQGRRNTYRILNNGRQRGLPDHQLLYEETSRHPYAEPNPKPRPALCAGLQRARQRSLLISCTCEGTVGSERQHDKSL